MCSLTAGYFPAIARNKADSFEETLAKVHAAMEANKLKQEELGQLFLMELAFAPGNIVPRLLDPFLSSVFVTPSFSNIGVVDPGIADFGDAPIRDMIPAGPMTSPPHFVLGSSTFNGEMTLSSTVCGTKAYIDMVESFFEALVRELPGYEQYKGEVEAIPGHVVPERPAQEHTGEHLREKSVSDA